MQVVEDDAEIVFEVVGRHVGGPGDDDVAVGVDEVGLVGWPTSVVAPVWSCAVS